MRNVAISKDVVVGTDARDFAVTGRAVDGHVFAECVVVADFRAGNAAVPF